MTSMPDAAPFLFDAERLRDQSHTVRRINIYSIAVLL